MLFIMCKCKKFHDPKICLYYLKFKVESYINVD